MSTSTQVRRLLRGLALLSCAVSLAAASAQAQENDVPLVVSVTGPRGEAIAAARVTVSEQECECGTCPAGKTCSSRCCDCRQEPCVCCIDSLTGVTDEDGRVEFRVHQGTFKAVIEVQNFKPLVQGGIRVTREGRNRVEVKLDAGPGIDDAPASKGRDFSRLLVEVTDAKNKPVADVDVRVRRLGCACGTCPSGRNCASNCCDCRGGECFCCVDTSDVTTVQGEVFANLQPGTYEVTFSRDGKALGTLSGLVVPPKTEVKLPARVEVTGP